MRSNLIRSESHHDLYYDNTNQMKNPPWSPILLLVKVIMDVHAGPWIYRLVADNHARQCIVRRQPLHAYVWRWCVHACLNTQHWHGACVKNCTLAPHTEQDRFMMCRCTSHFDSMGGIHAYTCMCVCSNCIMHVIPEHDLYIYIYDTSPTYL